MCVFKDIWQGVWIYYVVFKGVWGEGGGAVVEIFAMVQNFSYYIVGIQPIYVKFPVIIVWIIPPA